MPGVSWPGRADLPCAGRPGGNRSRQVPIGVSVGLRSAGACHDVEMQEIEIAGDVIRLGQLLKLSALADSGSGCQSAPARRRGDRERRARGASRPPAATRRPGDGRRPDRPGGLTGPMAYATSEARQELLDTVARAANELGLASALLAEAYEQLDEDSGDRLEEHLLSAGAGRLRPREAHPHRVRRPPRARGRRLRAATDGTPLAGCRRLHRARGRGRRRGRSHARGSSGLDAAGRSGRSGAAGRTQVDPRAAWRPACKGPSVPSRTWALSASRRVSARARGRVRREGGERVRSAESWLTSPAAAAGA